VVVDDGDDFLALLVLVAGIADAIAPVLATVLVPSPWSTRRCHKCLPQGAIIGPFRKDFVDGRISLVASFSDRHNLLK
jgi:hypothetical protein